MTSLHAYGWTAERQSDWSNKERGHLLPARVVADFGRRYKVAMPDEIHAHLAGALTHKLQATEMPKIGDWVAIEVIDGQPATIQEVLPRTSELVRGQVGRMLDKQIVAANVDLAFIVQPLDHDFSPERLERYIFQLTAQRINPVILLNKSDQSKHTEQRLDDLKSLGVDILVMSALFDEDMNPLKRYLTSGSTIVILGSSGAGKSTLTNRLLGEDRQATQSIREKDSKGRHTTVHRELFLLPSGSMVIDTPGIRELQLWGNEQDLEASFPDIFEVARQCHYNNCTHTSEDRCAIKRALTEGTIDPKRYKTYLNFKQELTALDTRRDFIAERRTQQSKESAKRRQRRTMRHTLENDPATETDQ